MRSELHLQSRSQVDREARNREDADSKGSTADSDKYSGDRVRASARMKGDKETGYDCIEPVYSWIGKISSA